MPRLHPALLAAGPARLEPGPVHLLQRRVQHLAEVAAVIGLLHRRHVRHGRRRHHVAAAQLHPVNPGLERGGVNQPLDDVVALRPPGAAVGVHWHRVGEHADHVGVDRLEAIDAGQHLGARHRRDHRRVVGQVGAHVGDVAYPHRQELAVLVQRDLTLHDVVAAVRVGQERLAALAGPLHRTAQLAGGVAGQRVLGVQEQLHAEAAAHVGRDDAEPVLGHVEHGAGQHAFDAPAALGVGVQGPAPARRVVLGDGGAGLHAGDDDAVVDHRQARDVRSLAEQLVRAGPCRRSPSRSSWLLRHPVPHLRLPGRPCAAPRSVTLGSMS